MDASAPRTEPPPLPGCPQVRYYKIDSRRLTFGECWHLTRSPAVLIAWIAKILRIPLALGKGIPRHPSSAALRADPAELSPPIRALLAGPLQGLFALGFRDPDYLTLTGHMMTAEVGGATCFQPSGEIVARVLAVHNTAVNPPKSKAEIHLLTCLADGRLISTGNAAPGLLPPPESETALFPGAKAEDLYRVHLKRLEAARRQGLVRPARNAAEFEPYADAVEERAFAFQVRRGIYVEMTADEVREMQELVAASGARDEYAPVLAELARRQKSEGSLIHGLILLIISVAVFAGAGIARWEPSFVLPLILVLFVHELGHFAAMKIFGYRNMKMFFIPLFGAAVTGTRLRQPGWKKAVVSLMGPLPGIAIGALLALAALLAHNAGMGKVALIFLVLNGLNLLPFPPLDGGWFMHAVVFSRNRWLESVFTACAALGLLLLGTPGAVMTVLVLLSVPTSFRTGTVVARLRAAGRGQESGESAFISRRAAVEIIDEIRAVFPPQISARAGTVAAIAKNVYERIHTPPPGAAASVGLIAVYLAALFAALLFAAVAGFAAGRT